MVRVAESVETDGSRTVPLRILIVDDEPDSLYGLDEGLSERFDGADVFMASDPEKALGFVRDGIDIMVSDQRMPRMTGLELIKRAREIDPGLPAIMVTGYPDLDLVMRAINEHHVSSFIVKPVDLDEIAAKVQRILELGR